MEYNVKKLNKWSVRQKVHFIFKNKTIIKCSLFTTLIKINVPSVSILYLFFQTNFEGECVLSRIVYILMSVRIVQTFVHLYHTIIM